MEDVKYEDKPLADRPTKGSQWCGRFVEANVGMETGMSKNATLSADKLRQVRVEANANVAERLLSSNDTVEAEIWGQVQEHCRLGGLIEPKIATISVAKRIPILQEIDDGIKEVRVVDHAKVSCFKEATAATATRQAEGINVAIIT